MPEFDWNLLGAGTNKHVEKLQVELERESQEAQPKVAEDARITADQARRAQLAAEKSKKNQNASQT